MRSNLAISLSAISANYKLLSEKSATAQCAAVVKANAYGLGVAAVANTLYESGAREFFVALVEEGAELRAILPDATIYVLNGILPNEEKLFTEQNLIPVLNDAGALSLWQNAAKSLNKKLPAVLHIDTGLNRLGFADVPENIDGLNIKLVMSHLACADTPENPINVQQHQRFKNAIAKLPGVRASLAASDGIFCGSDFHFDLMRPGAALYGLNPTPSQKNPMQNVIQLDVPVLQTRVVAQDGFVGYAATHTVTRGQRLATVSLGYADGFFRSLSNKGQLFHNGTALPLLGRVSMDVVVVDMSAIPENALHAGDSLQVFGDSQTPDQLAKAAGTIGYEVLTALGPRFNRVYHS